MKVLKQVAAIYHPREFTSAIVWRMEDKKGDRQLLWQRELELNGAVIMARNVEVFDGILHRKIQGKESLSVLLFP